MIDEMKCYSHDRFRDVVMLCIEMEKPLLSGYVIMNVQWWSKDGRYCMGQEDIVMTNEVFNSFYEVPIP